MHGVVQSLKIWHCSKKIFVNLKVIKLEQNYRSTSRILKAANHVIENNPHIFDKKLWSDKGHGEVIRIITCRNDDDESERVVKDLLTHKLMNGKNWKDYAVLYRGNFQARVLELSYVKCRFHTSSLVVNLSLVVQKLRCDELFAYHHQP